MASEVLGLATFRGDAASVQALLTVTAGHTYTVLSVTICETAGAAETFNLLIDDGGGGAGENHIFIMNAVDYLLGDRELIDLRSREITSRPLEELEDAKKSWWKWANILFPSILVVSFGFIRLKRESGRSKVLEEIYD